MRVTPKAGFSEADVAGQHILGLLPMPHSPTMSEMSVWNGCASVVP